MHQYCLQMGKTSESRVFSLPKVILSAWCSTVKRTYISKKITFQNMRSWWKEQPNEMNYRWRSFTWMHSFSRHGKRLINSTTISKSRDNILRSKHLTVQATVARLSMCGAFIKAVEPTLSNIHMSANFMYNLYVQENLYSYLNIFGDKHNSGGVGTAA